MTEYADAFYFEETVTRGYDPSGKRLFNALRVTEEGILLLSRLIANKSIV